MGYIVGRGRLKVGETYRETGDPIPEAATWPNLSSYLSSGLVVGFPDPPPSADPTSRETPVPPPADDEEDASQRDGDGASRDGEVDVTAMNADQAKAWIVTATDRGELQAQQEREVQNPKHPGGRVSVLRAIDGRLEDLKPEADDVETRVEDKA